MKFSVEVGLVHGSGFVIVGDMPILTSGSRFHAEKAAELLSDGTIERVICSGRGPVYGIDYPTSEALLSADHLVRLGVQSSRIEVEAASTSAIGNWSNSAPIVRELGATSAIGVTGKASIPRMYTAGSFVSDRSGFELCGYFPSEKKNLLKDYARELVNYEITRRFLAANLETPIDTLAEAYEAYKRRIGLSALKSFMHRDSVLPSNQLS